MFIEVFFYLPKASLCFSLQVVLQSVCLSVCLSACMYVCLFLFISLSAARKISLFFVFKLLQCGPLDGQLIALYHTSSLLLFSRLMPGDEYYAHDLMSTVIYNPVFFQ